MCVPWGRLGGSLAGLQPDGMQTTAVPQWPYTAGEELLPLTVLRWDGKTALHWPWRRGRAVVEGSKPVCVQARNFACKSHVWLEEKHEQWRSCRTERNDWSTACRVSSSTTKKRGDSRHYTTRSLCTTCKHRSVSAVHGWPAPSRKDYMHTMLRWTDRSLWPNQPLERTRRDHSLPLSTLAARKIRLAMANPKAVCHRNPSKRIALRGF